MLSDRNYMRRPWGGGRSRSFIITLLMVLVGVLFIEAVFENILKTNIIHRYFALSGVSIQGGFFWSAFSYMFLHADFMHLLVNGLLIFFIGQALEQSLGSKRIAYLFFTSGILGGLIWLMLHFNGASPLVGASAGALGLLTYFCLLNPTQPITLLLFFVLPVTILPKWLLLITLAFEGFSLVFGELAGTSNVANSAHLGGMLGGYLCFQLFNKGIATPKIFEKKPSTKARKPNYTVNLPQREMLKKEVDRILDKINAHGFGALTSEEKKILDQAKDLLKP